MDTIIITAFIVKLRFEISLYAEEKLKQNLFDSRFLYLVQSSSISHQVDKEEEHPGDEVNYCFCVF